MGGYTRSRPERDEGLDEVFDLFPALEERRTPARGHDVGRPAADARHRPGADGAAVAA